MLDEQEAAAAKVLLLPASAVRRVSRAACTQDTWYPAHRNCSCCKGFIHGAAQALHLSCALWS